MDSKGFDQTAWMCILVRYLTVHYEIVPWRTMNTLAGEEALSKHVCLLCQFRSALKEKTLLESK